MSSLIPSPVPSPTLEPSWLDLANFWVSAGGALANALIAVVAVWLTISTARASTRRDQRARREAWVRDFMLWLDDGSLYMASGTDIAILTDRAWIARGQELDARARLIEPHGTKNNILKMSGASAYMSATRTAREHIENFVPAADSIEAATTATRMLKLWAEGWVDDPKAQPGDISEWISITVEKPAPSEPEESRTGH